LPTTDLAGTAPADLVITGARVRCTRDREATGVAIRNDRIVALGDTTDLADLIGPATRVIRSKGGLVLPGFQDSHVHTPFAGRNRLRVWLNDIAGRQDYLAAIAEYAAANPDEPWIIGGGWAMEYFPGGTPRREDLDAIVPDRPVFLFNKDVHGAWVNTLALEMGGITADTPDPWDGRIERDPSTGVATGTLHEGAAYSFNERVLPPASAAEWEAAVLEGQRHLHSLGLTGWQDAWVTPATLEAYRSLAADGRLTARVVGALWWDRHRGLEQIDDLLAQRQAASGAAQRSGAPVPGFFPTTVKIMTDGVLENYTGALMEPYCDGCGGHTDNHGFTYLDHDELSAAVVELDREGFQVHMHAIGDRAVRNSLDAVEAARARNGKNDNRHHIAHVQIVHPDDVARFGELDIVANCQPLWAQSDAQMEVLTVPFLGADRAQQQYAFESIRRHGARLCIGSDWSVTTANPLELLEVAITRTDPRHRDNQPFLPGERLSVDDALDAFTAGSAFVNHDEDGGTIELGRRADLVLLDEDVLADGFASPGRAPIADARVLLTVAGGTVVHDIT
jgi:predicted amidohydrolase YtcJ